MAQTRTVGSQKITTYYDRDKEPARHEKEREIRRKKRSQQMSVGQKIAKGAKPVIADIKTMASGRGNREPWVFHPPPGYYSGVPGGSSGGTGRAPKRKGKSHREREPEAPNWQEMMEVPANVRQWWAF